MTNYNSLYNIYVERFDKAEKEMAKKNLPMAYDYKLNKEQFKAQFEAMKTQLVESGASPAELKDTRVVRAVVDGQKYGTSEKQGRNVYMAVRRWAEEKGIPMEISEQEIRVYNEYTRTDNNSSLEELPVYQRERAAQLKAFYEDIDAKYWQLVNSGASSKAAKSMIAQIYFGSP